MNRKIKILSIGLVTLLTIGGSYLLVKKDKKEIAPLLERLGPISTTSEWINTKKAIETLQTQIRLNSENYKAKLLLALAYMQEARITGDHPYYYPAALDLLASVLSNTNKEEGLYKEAIVAKASVLLSLHQFEKAKEIGEEALTSGNANSAIYGVLCDAYVELGDYTNAVKVTDLMIALKPDLRSYSRVSYLREIHGDLNGAIEAMKLAVSAGLPGLEQTAWTRINLAKLYQKKGDLPNAELQYKLALYETPFYAFAIAGIGSIAESKKDYKSAIRFYQEAGKIIPEFSFTENLAQLYVKIGKDELSHQTAEEVIEMLEEDVDAGHKVDLELANLYTTLLHDYDTALEYAENEYEVRPNNIDVNTCLALIHYKKEDYNPAYKFIKVASRTKRNDSDLLTLTGLILNKMGQIKASNTIIKQSFKLNPYQNDVLAKEAKMLISNS